MADDREGDEQLSGPPPPPVIPEEDRIYLSSQPDGVWWGDKRIVELIGRSFTDTYHEYVTCWSDASARQRDVMYHYFANPRPAPTAFQAPRHSVVQNQTQSASFKTTRANKGVGTPGAGTSKPRVYEMKRTDDPEASMISDYVLMATSGCQTLHFTRLMKRPEDPEWSAKAGKAKANRLKGGKDGKGPPTSTLGQQSVARAFSSLGTDSRTPHGLLCKSKKNKKGEWITPRAEEIDAEY
ncbi:hypothetical protein OROGR_024589 [Orobanche gracilis]